MRLKKSRTYAVVTCCDILHRRVRHMESIKAWQQCLKLLNPNFSSSETPKSWQKNDLISQKWVCRRGTWFSSRTTTMKVVCFLPRHCTRIGEACGLWEASQRSFEAMESGENLHGSSMFIIFHEKCGKSSGIQGLVLFGAGGWNFGFVQFLWISSETNTAMGIRCGCFHMSDVLETTSINRRTVDSTLGCRNMPRCGMSLVARIYRMQMVV